MRITGKKKINRKCTENLCNNKNKNIGNQHADGKARYQTVHTEVHSFFQLPRMNTETPLLTLALFFALLQLITYYPLAVYMRERERERERERCTCEF